MIHESKWWRPIRESGALDLLERADFRVINAMMQWAVGGRFYGGKERITDLITIDEGEVHRTWRKLEAWGVLVLEERGTPWKPGSRRFVSVTTEFLQTRISRLKHAHGVARAPVSEWRTRHSTARRSIDKSSELKGAAGGTKTRGTAAAQGEKTGGGSAPAPPKAIVKALEAGGIGNPELNRLARAEGITVEMIEAIVKRCQRRGKGPGIMVEEIRTALRKLNPETPDDAVLVKWLGWTKEMRFEVWSDYVAHRRKSGDNHTSASPSKTEQAEHVRKSPVLRKLIQSKK